MDRLSDLTEDQVTELSQCTPQEFLVQLQALPTTTQDADASLPQEGQQLQQHRQSHHSTLLTWETLQPHGYFLGSHLALLRMSLGVYCPLLLGFLQVEKDEDYDEEGQEKRESGEPTVDPTKHEILNDPKAMTELAVKAETWTRQSPWGQPLNQVFANGHLSPKKKRKYTRMRIGVKKEGESDNQSVASREELKDELSRLGFIPTVVPVDQPNHQYQPSGIELTDSSLRNGSEGEPQPATLATPERFHCKDGILKVTASGKKKRKLSVHWDGNEDDDDLVAGDYNDDTGDYKENMPTLDSPQRQEEQEENKENIPVVDSPQRQEELDQKRSAGTPAAALDEAQVIVLCSDSDSDSSDGGASVEDRQQQQEVKSNPTRFRIQRQGQNVVVNVDDLSSSMMHVMEQAKNADTKSGVFGWNGETQRGLVEGKLTLQIRVGYAFFTRDYFGTLAARDVVDMAPAPQTRQPPVNELMQLGAGGGDDPSVSHEVVVDLELIDANSGLLVIEQPLQIATLQR